MKSPAARSVDIDAANRWLAEHKISPYQASQLAGVCRHHLRKVLSKERKGAKLSYWIWWIIVARSVLAEQTLTIIDATAAEALGTEGDPGKECTDPDHASTNSGRGAITTSRAFRTDRN